MDRKTVLSLVAMGMGVFVIANDITAMNVALPAIEKDFDTGVSTVQWVINAYALCFGVLIVTGGRLADLFGRREAFFLGAGIFAGLSLLGGAAQTEAWLIACRALMGIGGALMWPAILGMTYAALPKDKAGLAGGLIIGVAGLGNALGPLIGGALTEFLSWRWILFANVPISLLAMTVVYLYIHQPKPEDEERRIDYGGIVTLSLGLVLFMVALDQAIDFGWDDPFVVVSVVISVIMLILFGLIERRVGPYALVPKDVMRNRSFTATCLAILLMSGTFFATLLYVPQYLQKEFSYNAFESGLGLLPFMGVFALSSFIAGPLYNRLGAKLIVSVGSASFFLGPLLIGLGIEANGTYASIVPGLVLLGTGVGLFFSAATTAAITSVDESRSSLAGGIIYMFQIAGGSVGLAVTTTVFASQSGLISGLHAAFGLNAALAFGGFLVALFFVGGRLGGKRREAAG